MGIVILLLVIAFLLACAHVWKDNLRCLLCGECWACCGYGTVTVRGDRIPIEELTAKQYAEHLVNGTNFYRPVKSPCNRCKGTGRKRVK